MYFILFTSVTLPSLCFCVRSHFWIISFHVHDDQPFSSPLLGFFAGSADFALLWLILVMRPATPNPTYRRCFSTRSGFHSNLTIPSSSCGSVRKPHGIPRKCVSMGIVETHRPANSLPKNGSAGLRDAESYWVC